MNISADCRCLDRYSNGTFLSTSRNGNASRHLIHVINFHSSLKLNDRVSHPYNSWREFCLLGHGREQRLKSSGMLLFFFYIPGAAHR